MNECTLATLMQCEPADIGLGFGVPLAMLVFVVVMAFKIK